MHWQQLALCGRLCSLYTTAVAAPPPSACPTGASAATTAAPSSTVVPTSMRVLVPRPKRSGKLLHLFLLWWLRSLLLVTVASFAVSSPFPGFTFATNTSTSL